MCKQEPSKVGGKEKKKEKKKQVKNVSRWKVTYSETEHRTDQWFYFSD